MDKQQHLVEYAELVGGIYNLDEIEAIPYNHWKKDFEWIVLVIEESETGAFVPVVALTSREACYKAIYKYKQMKEEDE